MVVANGLTLDAEVNLGGVFQGTLEDREDNTRYWISTNGGSWAVNGSFANSEVWDWTGLLYTTEEAPFHQGYKVTVDGVDFALFYDANFGSDSLYGGNDIVLIATVPEPLAGTLLLAALGSIALQRRRRVPRHRLIG
ncbi:PEP-CTERM sorting domain-containing protein [Verrucomicrobium spinosum]|nr:PEP-CTERM sorting domain-containing protein [Verrucomicrobium spinosum]